MLYVKVDADGNPVEVAKNYNQIKAGLLSENKILPSEMIFSAEPQRFGYAEVGYADPLPPKNGKSVVPDVPVKNTDGTFTRKYKYKDVDSSEAVEDMMRKRRNYYLVKYVDTVSPLRWNSLSDTQKQEATDWYESLKNLPDSEGWPYVTIPAVPAFLLRG